MLECILCTAGGFLAAFVSVKVVSLLRMLYVMRNGSTPDFKKFGKWAVVTGSTDGIGKAYAQQLASCGMDIVLVSRSPTKLQQTAQQIESKYGVRTKIIAIDFTHGQEIFEVLKDELSDVDVGVLVNNVGMLTDYPQYFVEGEENKMEVIHNIMTCNMNSAVFLTYHVLPKMLQNKRGAIINISSLSAAIPCPLLQVYAATKSFVDSLTQATAYEYKDSGVVIQCILPGLVATNMSGIKSESATIPGPETFVKSALRTVGKYSRTGGFWYHEVELFMAGFISALSQSLAINLVFTMMRATRKRILARRGDKKEN